MNRLGAKLKGAKAYLRSCPKPRKSPPTLDESLGSSASVQAKDSVRISTTQRPAGPEKVSTTPNAVGESSARSSKIWDEALSKLPDKEQNVLLGVSRPDSKLDLLQYMLDETEKREVECRSRKWKIKIGTDREIVVADKAAKIVQWLNKFKSLGDVAINYDPVHAALPWAGVRLLLEAAVADTEAKAALVVALERMVYLIGRCRIYEKLYLDDKPAPSPDSVERQLEETLTKLYTDILSFLCTALGFYDKSAIHRTYVALLNQGKLQEFLSVLEYSEERAHRDADNCSSAQNATANKDLLENGQYLRELLDSWKDPIMHTASSLANIQDRLTQEEREKILTWISSIEYPRLHHTARENRVKGTGSWILDHKQFLEWKRSNQSKILWLHGVPGAGKTKLTSRVVDDFLTKHESQPNPNHGLAYFYCDRNQSELGDHEIIMNSILMQLATTGEGSILSPVLELHKKKRGSAFAPGSPLFAETVAVLQEVLSKYQNVTVIVDALDECEPKARKNLITEFNSLIDSANNSLSTVFKLFISSRRNEDIVNALKNTPNLALEATDNREDIAKFISDGIDPLPIKSVLKEEIGRTLQNQNEGVFQWVALQLYRVQELSPIEKDIRKYLGKLPKDLKEAYDEIYARIVEQSDTRKEIAERTFQWIACSTGPLSPDKLIAAVCQDPSTDEVDPIDDGITIEFILGACHNLLVVDPHSNTCRFSHLSVQEYIEESHWNRSQSNGLVGKVSLSILNSPCYWNDEEENFPPGVDAIVPYVAKNWPLHVQRHGEKDIDPRLATLLKRFLGSMNDASPAYTYWNTYLGTFGKTSRYAWYIRRRLQPSSRASLAIAFFGFHKFLADWWDTGFDDIEERNQAGTTLLALAAQGGRFSGVAALIDKGAVVHARRDGLTPLGGAVLGQNKEIVELVLDRGADVNVVNCQSDSALSLAAKRKNKEIVKLLLDRGADVNSSSRFSSPLGAATTGGDRETVDLLLDRGADVNAGGGSDGSPLGSASARGNINVVKLLLNRGADINKAGGIEGSPLGAASCWGNKGTVKLLLDRGADVNKAGGMHGPPLGTASARGNKGIVELLINRGADINKVGGIHGSPLGGAIAGKHKSILELLLHSGADVNAVGGSYGSPLGVAARVGDRDVAELLLNKGADVNAPGKDYSGPLEVAAAGGYRDTVKLLLERGANANAKGGKYGSPLAAAASDSRGNKEIVELLLDSGADVDGVGGKSSPLYLARRRGKKDIMDLLIERGGNAPSESSSSEWSVDI